MDKGFKDARERIILSEAPIPTVILVPKFNFSPISVFEQ